MGGPGFESRQRYEMFLSFKTSKRPGGQPSLLFNGHYGSFPGVKGSGREAEDSPPSIANVKIEIFKNKKNS